jgi:hypothetical protein
LSVVLNNQAILASRLAEIEAALAVREPDGDHECCAGAGCRMTGADA